MKRFHDWDVTYFNRLVEAQGSVESAELALSQLSVNQDVACSPRYASQGLCLRLDVSKLNEVEYFTLIIAALKGNPGAFHGEGKAPVNDDAEL